MFSREPEAIILPDDAVLSPLPIDENVSSLSAILLDHDYYEFLKQGRAQILGVTVLDALHLIPFKAKAWPELSDMKNNGEHVDSKNIKKQKNDVFRLTELLSRDQESLSELPESIKSDMQSFIMKMSAESIDLERIGIRSRTQEAILIELSRIYCQNQ